MRRNKWITLLAGLTFTAAILCSCDGRTENIETLSPERGSIIQTVEETGLVVFDESYPVTSIVSARVLTSEVNEGDTVSKGQLLYTLDSTDITNQISQTNISLEKANEAYHQSLNAVKDLTVKSYASGVVTNVYCHVGDYVSTGSVIAEVVDSDTLLLSILFLPSDINSIFVNSQAEVFMDIDATQTTGTVTKVYESTQVLEGRQVGVMVEIELKNPGALRQGDTAYARINGITSAASGSLKNKTEQSISATQSGQVKELNISEGSLVNSGNTVMVIKNDSLQNAVNNAAISVKEIQNTLDQLERKLSDYEITAPIDGVVIDKSAKESDLAAAGTPLATLADNNKLYINVDIDEMYINNINIGQNAVATVQGNRDLTYAGQVIKISDSGAARNGVTYYTVKISLDSQDKLMEAMNMDVVITVASSDDALLIPAKVLYGSTVKVLIGNDVVEKEVTVGIKNKQYAEILDGLTEQDQIVAE